MKISDYKDKKFLENYKERARMHRLVPFKKIVDLLHPIKNKKILDIGCGSGELDEMLIKKGAQVTGVDKSQEWISYCLEVYHNNHLSFICTDASKRLPFQDDSFDAVVINMVFLNVAKLSEVKAIIDEVGRIIKKGGIFVFSDLHPICIMAPHVKPNRYQKYSPNFSYFKDGANYTAGIFLNNGKKIEFHNKHWTLETYSTFLENAGFFIQKIVEPTYRKKAPKLLRQYKIPEYILICSRKK